MPIVNKSYNMNIDTGEKTWLTPPEIIDALDEADYALAHNAPRPRQEDLFGGAL